MGGASQLFLKGFEVVAWNGLAVPAKTPRAVIVKTSEAVAKIVTTPEQFRQRIVAEINRWKKLVAEANIKVQ